MSFFIPSPLLQRSNNPHWQVGVSRAGSGKKDLSKAVNDDTMEKIRQMAQKHAEAGEINSKERNAFIRECCSYVAPDRQKIFSEAAKQMEKAAKNSNFHFKSDAPYGDGSIFDYIRMVEDAEKANGYYKITAEGRLDGGFFKGECSRGNIFMKMYDEKGEHIGTYSGNSGWEVCLTKLEEQCDSILSKAYSEAYFARRKQIDAAEQSRRQALADKYGLDVYA